MADKKKILFIIPGLHAGGGEKALVNLLNELNAGLYDIDLLLFSKSGLFLEQIPPSVNIIQPEGNYTVFAQPLVQSVKALLLTGKWLLAINRIKYAQELRKHDNAAIAEQQSWKYLGKSIPRLNKEYDAAIAYLEKSSIYYVVDKVNAKKKIGWIHNDYSKLQLDKVFDQSYFEQLHKIVTVSEKCEAVLKETFPEYREKVEVMYNITSKQLIRNLAENEDVKFDKRYFNIVSVGRLEKQKGFDMAIEAVYKLPVEIREKIKWHIIGEGVERNELEAQIKKYSLEKHFVLLGLKANPYPYIGQATIYCQPSRFEGKSIAIDEAKLLAKPILVTNFSTVTDQLEHDKTAWIVDINAYAIAMGIKRLYEDEKLRNSIVDNLINFESDTIYQLEKFKVMIDG